MTWLIVITVWLTVLTFTGESQQPRAIVAQDGSGDFTTITGAIFASPNHSVQPYYIKVKTGTYHEYVQIEKWKTNIVLIGEGTENTIITGNKSFGGDGIQTLYTATVSVKGQGFTAQDITFRNEAGPWKYQAVALVAEADYISFYRCRFEGYQDTLYTRFGKHFYRDCQVLGTIDFICGHATAVFQNSIIEVRAPIPGQFNTITAQKREEEGEATGIVLQNCTIKATPELEKMGKNVTTYLGRPWGNYSRTVFMQSDIDLLINPKGWIEFTNETLIRPYYLEYMNRGEGANTMGRVKWAIVTSDPKIASNFTVRNFINGDKWIPFTIPYYLDLA
ncbi:pectinesterase/pectinesterase inhibitor PPE8B-like [Nicotiana tomentosiformis]|uniref:pectinesterase/pectinesterase inhibitor PPE8B-like n=1 Tax=Nicotiana tomentosiformis TaxID=4098 RepID=UPI00388C9840